MHTLIFRFFAAQRALDVCFAAGRAVFRNLPKLLSPRDPSVYHRKPDAELIARLGAAVDRALSAAKPGHLTEMCTMRSPSPTARRLVLGLIVAFGLR